MEEDYVTKLVVARLNTMPPNVKFSIGAYGTFTKEQLIDQVLKETPLGRETIKSELRFLREMPRLTSRLLQQQ